MIQNDVDDENFNSNEIEQEFDDDLNIINKINNNVKEKEKVLENDFDRKKKFCLCKFIGFEYFF